MTTDSWYAWFRLLRGGIPDDTSTAALMIELLLPCGEHVSGVGKLKMIRSVTVTRLQSALFVVQAR